MGQWGAILIASLAISSGLAWPEAVAESTDSLGGHYTVTLSSGESHFYTELNLEQDGDKLTGQFGGTPIVGTRKGGELDLVARYKDGTGGENVHLVAKGRSLVGTDVRYDNTDHHTKYQPFTVTAEPKPTRLPTAPKTYDFAPSQFYRDYSAYNKPALVIASGDTVHTTTIDASGVDARGVARSLSGNPETGPFYITGAMPGDTLAVHIIRLRLNRDWAISDDALVGRSLNSGLAVTMKDNGKTVYWHLNLDKGTASLEKPDDQLKNYAVPLRPMLGCIAVAPTNLPPPSTPDSGSYGGNMDFNEIVEGTTVYLPVRNPGALLYVGDGHAAMADGEMNGNGLETSMDMEFRVEVISDKAVPSPRVESSTSIMALGYEGSLDDSLKTATVNMARWLNTDYKLNPSEVAEVLGTASQIRVSEVADRNAGVALIIDKSNLKGMGTQ